MKKITIESAEKALNTCFDCTLVGWVKSETAIKNNATQHGNLSYTYARVGEDMQCVALFNPIEIRDILGNYELRGVYITVDEEDLTIWRYIEGGYYKQYSSFDFKDYDNQACLFVAITRDLMMLFD